AWKLPKTRMKNLVRCGINKYDARRWGYVKGYWRVSSSPIMHLAASSQKLHQVGYPMLMGSYLEWYPK
ncbi:MAG: group II intron reverse transcriptase/maturase, partial [Prevotella sp.]|nr:group II intron reverse transcriptase/maturase [Prevotella sp.]